MPKSNSLFNDQHVKLILFFIILSQTSDVYNGYQVKNCLPAVQYSKVNKISNVVDDYEVFS